MVWQPLLLYSVHALVGFERQALLSTFVAESCWRFDMASGQLSFGDRYQWQAQILGTESDETRTWLWAWANEAINIPPNLLGAAKTVRFYGEHHRIAEFTTPQLEHEEILVAKFDEQNRLTNLEASLESSNSSSGTAPVTKGS